MWPVFFLCFVFCVTSLRHTFSAGVNNVCTCVYGIKCQISEMKQTVHNRCQLCLTGSVNGRAWNINNQLPLFLACSVQVELYNNNNNNRKNNNKKNNNKKKTTTTTIILTSCTTLQIIITFCQFSFQAGSSIKTLVRWKFTKYKQLRFQLEQNYFGTLWKILLFYWLSSLVKCQKPLLNKKKQRQNILSWFETSLAHLKTPKQRDMIPT